MTTINKSALVNYSAKQMFMLVDDIDRYAEFVPWCTATESRNRTENSVEGTIYVSKGKIKLSFSTYNELAPYEEIRLKLVDGPFKHLTGTWTFTALGEHACKVHLRMEFEFSSKVMELALGYVFGHMANNMLDAFCKRAKEVYGHNNGTDQCASK